MTIVAAVGCHSGIALSNRNTVQTQKPSHASLTSIRATALLADVTGILNFY